MTGFEPTRQRPTGDGTESASETEMAWYDRRWTTLVLDSLSDGWRASQPGVDVEGHGESAAAAAADYCLRIARQEGTVDSHGELPDIAEAAEGRSSQ